MDVKVFDNDTEAGKYAFDLIKQGMDNGAKVLGLATGSTPVTMYQAMVNSDVDFSNMTSVNLDEYVGMSPDNDQSYHYFMKSHLLTRNRLRKPSCQMVLPRIQKKKPSVITK